jgi:hypothetical protein
MMSQPSVTCALLSNNRAEWPAQHALACPGFTFVTLAAAAMGVCEAPNPFGLPEGGAADVVLLTGSWERWLRERHADRAAQIMEAIEHRCTAIVGLEPGDDLGLSLSPQSVERMAVVIKPQGLYRDRDLYNYEVGPVYAGALWTEKLRPRRSHYPADHLDKLRLSVPCYVTMLPGVRAEERSRQRGAARTTNRDMSPAERVARNVADHALTHAVMRAPLQARRSAVHCVVSLTHVQRLQTMAALEGLPGHQGIVSVPTLVGGTEYGLDPPVHVMDELRVAADRYRYPQVGRMRFLMDLCRHDVAIAPTGYGEITFRHGEAWMAGAALVCQDLSHVETMFPLEDGRNVRFCKPDLSDLRAAVDELLHERETRLGIAREGRRLMIDWVSNWRAYLHQGFGVHLREALGRGPQVGCV